MSNYNPKNERIKRNYLAFTKEAQRYSEPTVDMVAAAISRFEKHTGYKDFRLFHHDQAVAFKHSLIEQRVKKTSKRVSHATAHNILSHLKRFFRWLAGQPGYKSRLKFSDADYFNLSEKEARVATAKRETRVPTIEQILTVLQKMPHATELELRDQAVIAFTLVSGARDSAIASMKLKHVDLAKEEIDQDAREVNTKFSKTFKSYFFPVPEEAKRIVVAWVEHRHAVCLDGGDAPLFPAETSTTFDSENNFCRSGLGEVGWETSGPIRAIFRKAFKAAEVPYFPPHSFRHTLVRFGETWCKTPEEFKAFSQNLGHEGVLTTFRSYGTVAISRQSELLRSRAMEKPEDAVDMAKLMEAAVVRALSQVASSKM